MHTVVRRYACYEYALARKEHWYPPLSLSTMALKQHHSLNLEFTFVGLAGSLQTPEITVSVCTRAEITGVCGQWLVSGCCAPNSDLSDCAANILDY